MASMGSQTGPSQSNPDGSDVQMEERDGEDGPGQSAITILEALPTELIAGIIDIVARESVQEARKLRLVCSVFNTLASPYGVVDTIAYLHRSDINAIRLMGAQSHIAMGVRSFTYVPDMVVHPGSLEDFLWEYRDLRKADIEEAPTMALRRKLRKKRMLTNSEIHTHWLRAKAHYSMQQSLIADEDDIEFLQDVLPRFHNLEELIMQSELTTMMTALADERGKSRRRRTPFDDGLGEFTWRPLQPEGLRAMNAMLEAVPMPNKITTLRAGALSWKFFDPANQLSISRCLQMAPNLTRIGFQVETGWDEYNELFGVEASQCRHMMRHGVLRDILRKSPNLEALYIDFEESDGVDAFPAHLHDLIRPQQHWPKLKMIEIGGFECDRQELQDFIKSHSGTLTEVFLRNISLRGTSWVHFLPELRAMCPNLKDAAINGPLWGENETSQHHEFWNVMPWTQNQDDQMCSSITAYLTCRLHDDHQNPFEVFPYTENHQH